jgi:hypothetical protein
MKLPLAVLSSALFITFGSSDADDVPKAPVKHDVDLTLVRKADGQVLSSPTMPAIKLKFDKAFKYVGGQAFVLYDVARAEQHFFVDADNKGSIKRMYWVQFEGYLPSNTHSYRYQSPKRAKIGDLEFIADSFARNVKTSPGRPDSDGSRARQFLEKKNLRMASDEVMAQRLVNLIDEQKRNELMIIYMEDLSPQKLTAVELAPEGRAAGQWEEISKALLERATKGIEIVR